MLEDDRILDVTDNNSGPRTCPECGFQYPLLLFVKRYVMKFGFPKWTCPNCHKFIKYNYTKSNLIAAIAFIVFVVLFQFLQSKYGLDLPNYTFLIPYFIFVLLQLNFGKLQKYKT